MERKVYAVVQKTEVLLGDIAYHTNKVFMDKQKAEQYCEKMNYEKFLEIYERKNKNIEKTFKYFIWGYSDFDIIKERGCNSKLSPFFWSSFL